MRTQGGIRMKRIARAVFMMATLAALGGCGGGGEGFISISLENAGIPAELAAQNPVLQITQFRATITADDIAEPIVATAEPTAAEILIETVPYGDNRTILVEALNSRGDVLRRRRMEGLEIKKGVVSNVRGRMNTVPVALNLAPGIIVPANRFRIDGFGEPGSSIRVISETESGAIPFAPSESDLLPLASASIDTGLFQFSQRPSATGKQTITLRDESTGESSQVSVYIINGELPGRCLSAAAAIDPTTTIGLPFGDAPQASFPLVLRAMTESSPEDNEEVAP